MLFNNKFWINFFSHLYFADLSEQGVVIDSRVYCFAIGLTVGTKNACYKQTANPY